MSNRSKVAAYRAPGAPIGAYAVECVMDELAEALKMDPLALRMKNAAKQGTKAAFGPVFPVIDARRGLTAPVASARTDGRPVERGNEPPRRLVPSEEPRPPQSSRTKLGLPASFDLRIGLHCGPIFCCEDPVTHTMLYTGSHTSRTARIEPITPPGQVYTSSAFAAVAAATGVDDLGFSYIGRIPLAKQYGSLALYHVQRPS